MEALAFLDRAKPDKTQPIYVISGDEDFLKRRCREAIVKRIFGNEDPTFALTSYAGEKLDFSTVRNELETLPFIGPARVIVIEQADPFITEHRAALEKYVATPSRVNVLILEAKTFPETTKLAKALPDPSKLVCKAPPAYKLPEWCVQWAKTGHRTKLNPDAAGLLVELIGPSMGQLDQELEKLAVAVGEGATIDGPTVQTLVGRSRGANVFHILDAVAEGKPAGALGILAELFEEGEDPLAILGALTASLRRLATVGRLLKQGESLGPAMDSAGVPRWPQARQNAEKLIRHLGRRRLEQLPEWLVEINLGLKGGNPLPGRVQIERLLVNLARPRAA